MKKRGVTRSIVGLCNLYFDVVDAVRLEKWNFIPRGFVNDLTTVISNEDLISFLGESEY